MACALLRAESISLQLKKTMSNRYRCILKSEKKLVDIIEKELQKHYDSQTP
jgi:hypothetical protein